MPSLDFIFKTCTGHDTAYWSGSGELEWYDKYANPRDDAGKGVLTANWNHFPRSAASDSHRTDEGKSAQSFNWGRGRKFQDILERLGYQLEWSDQTGRCESCYGCIHTDAAYYGDTSHYAILNECEMVCEDCIRKDFTEEYLEEIESNGSAVAIRGIDPAKHGYVKLDGGFENGLHPGQTDDPHKIRKALEEQGYTNILFTIGGSGQFDVEFSVWVKSPIDGVWQVECGQPIGQGV